MVDESPYCLAENLYAWYRISTKVSMTLDAKFLRLTLAELIAVHLSKIKDPD